MNIVLTGFMGTGKSSIGKLLSCKLGLKFVDTDALIEEQEGISINRIFEKHGEKYFRAIERKTVAGVSAKDNCVIATGGGVVLDGENMANLRKNGVIICLRARPEVIHARITPQDTRPLLKVSDPAAAIKEKLEERSPFYKGDLKLDTSDISPEDAADRIAAFTDQSNAQSYRIPVELGADSYDIHIGCGLLTHLDQLLGEKFGGARVMVVTNPTVYSFWGDILEEGLKKLTDKYSFAVVPDGEKYKSLGSAKQLYDKAVAGGLDRKSLIIAFGGGVIGDLAGFAASTYMRGVPFVQIPTTLLAQVDSSVGGKVAVNHPKGKNLIGSFYQPKLVIADTTTLLTLPRRELSNGLAEVIKYGMILDPGFFSYLEQNMQKILAFDLEAIAGIIEASCRFKSEIVRMDEKENNIRAILNYGHTIGHGIEASTGYKLFRHGEAIAIGMEGAALLATARGMLSEEERLRQRKLLQAAGLPVNFPGLRAKAVENAMKSDKKNVNGQMRFILANGMGNTGIVGDVTAPELEKVLKNLKL